MDYEEEEDVLAIAGEGLKINVYFPHRRFVFIIHRQVWLRR